MSDAGSGDAGPKRREIVVFEDPVTGVWRFKLEQHQIEVEPRRGYVKIDGVLHWDKRLEGLTDVSELDGRPLSAIDELLSSPPPSSRPRPWSREEVLLPRPRSVSEAPKIGEAMPSPDVDARVSKTDPCAEASDHRRLPELESVADPSSVGEPVVERPGSGRTGDRPGLPSESPSPADEEARSHEAVASEAELAYLSTPQAAGYLQLKPNTLERWRSDGGGPVFVKVGGRVFYRREDLDNFIESRRRKSTADPGTKDRT